jgi:hypothetical protein
MDENMSTPHPDDPAEGAPGVDSPEEDGSEGDSPLGGDETTEGQLQADNPAEEDTLKTLDPDSPPA